MGNCDVMNMIGILSINNQAIGHSGGSSYYKRNRETEKKKELSIIEHIQCAGTQSAAFTYIAGLILGLLIRSVLLTPY